MAKQTAYDKSLDRAIAKCVDHVREQSTKRGRKKERHYFIQKVIEELVAELTGDLGMAELDLRNADFMSKLDQATIRALSKSKRGKRLR